MCRHSPDLAVLSFAQNDFQPSGGDGHPIPNRHPSLPKTLRHRDTIDLTRPGHKITKIDPRRELLQGSIIRDPFNLDPVTLRELVAWVCNLGLQRPIVGKNYQSFGVGVEATSSIDLGHRQVTSQCGPPGRIGKLGQHPVGLVEKDEAAQLGQPPRKILLKRCSSG